MTIRNQNQLILVKQLSEDASILAARGDAFSLVKAVVLLDLAVEHCLNNIVVNLDPNFTVNEAKGTEDIVRKTLWGNAARAARMSGKGSLPETREMANLHALRNLVQHCGTQPSQSETQRYLSASLILFSTIFTNVYELDFSTFQIWDLVSNEELRNWLKDCETAMRKAHPEICVGGCNHAHEHVIAAIRKYTKLRRFRGSNIFSSSSSRPSYPSGIPLAVKQQIEGLAKKLDAEVRTGVARFRQEIMTEIEFLEDEVVAIGVGLPLMDTRRFQQIGSRIRQHFFVDGNMHISFDSAGQDREHFRDELMNGAEFMLSYLSRLLRLVEESYPGVLAPIKLGTPLRNQPLWGTINSGKSELAQNTK